MIRDLVDKILKEKSFCENIVPELRLNRDLGLDSLNLVELIVRLEEQFNIVINESDLTPSNLQTVGNVYSLVEKYMEG
jgi:acyl carrier protein